MDSFRFFVARNRDLLKTSLKGLGYSSAGLVAGILILFKHKIGFFLFFLANRKKLLSGNTLDDSERKEITLQSLEKLVNKIKDDIITSIVATNDKFYDYDPNEFINREDDIEVLEIDQDEEGTINNSLVHNNSGISELARNQSGISNNSELNLSRAVSMVNREAIKPAIRKKVKDASELSKHFFNKINSKSDNG